MVTTWTTTSPGETRAVAGEIFTRIGETGVLLLKGDLGAGKTCLVQGLADVMNLEEPVTSPTYGLLKEYGTPPKLIHADLYRLSSEDELLELGLEEWMESSVLCAIEWPERASGFWPDSAWTLRMEADPAVETVRTLMLHQERGS